MRTRYILYSFLVLSLVVIELSCLINQSTSKVEEIPALNYVEILKDAQGYLYDVEDGRQLNLYSGDGQKKLYNYSNDFYSGINGLDLRDNYKIALFYRENQKILLLDNTLSEIAVLDLVQLEGRYLTKMVRSVDGTFWLYDQNEQQLIEVDNELNVLQEAYPLYQEGLGSFSPLKMVLDRQRLIMASGDGRILIFDHLGNYKRKLETKPILQFNLLQDHLLFGREDGIYLYDLLSYEEAKIYDWVEGRFMYFGIDQKKQEIIIYHPDNRFQEKERIAYNEKI